MGLADKLNLNYISSIDTAFLDTPDVKIPDNIKNYFDRPYIVFVPNSLTWHPAYTHIDQNYIDDYYLKIINSINIIYKDYPIIMLPQLYNTEKKNDKLYFDRLKEQVKYNIIVLDDTISSDVQQTIIAGSQFIIGSRYHTIVFAINNNKPVIALSYEHKITGLLDILNMNDSLVNFDKIIHQGLDIEVFGKIIEQKIKNLHINEQAKKKAAEIASDCMKQFVTRYK
jgi:colanic acid/amylovoran biosynthesis protein